MNDSKPIKSATFELPPGKKIVTHPANLSVLRAALFKKETYLSPPGPFIRMSASVQTSTYVDKLRPTGRVVDRDGNVRERTGWTWQWDRFTTLEETDLPWAIRLGLVVEEMEPVFYIMDDFRIFTDWGVRFRQQLYVRTSVTA